MILESFGNEIIQRVRPAFLEKDRASDLKILSIINDLDDKEGMLTYRESRGTVSELGLIMSPAGHVTPALNRFC